ncbi:hypothetical protein [Pajaroellobacter abortibovis]|uniref:Uncharacterized protein n=1 Tax=Pajaroellobacter abortibovis TaxID=1882918 RepID=A0A1L6MVG7_9BACT|nr:hypothetical protein [Pajaroellobacter abortibovis]APR99516.1 hypothetical protein BCY86_01600 [Pajaroellobacter abortibovis]
MPQQVRKSKSVLITRGPGSYESAWKVLAYPNKTLHLKLKQQRGSGMVDSILMQGSTDFGIDEAAVHFTKREVFVDFLEGALSFSFLYHII